MADTLLPDQQPQASTSAAALALSAPRKMCSICNHRYSIYTCPRCAARTCSLPCSTGHKAATGCTGERDKVKYVPMNQYGWGTMMDDYVYLEEVGRRVGDWGKEIVRGGYVIQGASAMGRGRGRGGNIRGRGRGRGTTVGTAKREILKMQLDARDIDMDLLPVGMERRKLNQSYWEPKTHTAFLTIEFRIHPPRDPLKPSSQPLDPPYVLLTHRNSLTTPLLTLTRQITERALSKKDGAAPSWIRRLILPDPDDPDTFTPPHFVMTAQMDPRAVVHQKSSRTRAAYYRLDPTQTLGVLLRNTHFVEFPTIEVWEEFSGTVVDVEGAVTQTLDDDEPRPKRRKLTAKAGRQAINGLLGGYGSEDEEEAEPKGGLALLDGYAGSDDDGEIQGGDSEAKEDAGEEENVLTDSDDDVEVEIDPAVLMELMRARGESWTQAVGDDDEVDWGASGDENEPK